MGQLKIGKYTFRAIAETPSVEGSEATIYRRGAFGYEKVEVKQVAVYIGPYAQYTRAIQVFFLEKGKRKPTGYTETYSPGTLIIEGTDTPNPPDAFVEVPSGVSGMVCTRTRYASFAEEYTTEFNAMIAPYLATPGVKVLADYRNASTA